MSGQAFARSPSGKQAREREVPGFSMRTHGSGKDPKSASTAEFDTDTHLAELIHDRLDLGSTALDTSMAEKLSKKFARLATEELSEAQIEELTRSFKSLGRSTSGTVMQHFIL